MTDISTTSWSETDSGNNQQPPEGWPAGMNANGVEPSARMNMGAVKRFWNRVNPVYTTTLATTDSYTVSPTQAITGYGLNERWRVRFPSANTATSPNILISSLPAQVFQKYNGSGSLTNLAAGDIQAQDHEFWWNGTQMVLTNPTTLPAIVVNTLPTKATPTNADSVVIMDNAASNVAKTATIPAVVGALFSPITNSLSGDVLVNNAANFFDGPSVAQGSTGTWFASGYVTLLNTSGTTNFIAKLWDGTTVIASCQQTIVGANTGFVAALSGYLASPAGNIRISVKCAGSTATVMKANASGIGNTDSTISAIRIA